MYKLLCSLSRLSFPRTLLALVVFCACLLFSCAAGEQEVTPDGALQYLDVSDDNLSQTPSFDVPSSWYQDASSDLASAADQPQLMFMWRDASVSIPDSMAADRPTQPQRDAMVTYPPDARSIPDVISPPDVSFPDSMSRSEVDAAAEPVDVSESSLDVTTSMRCHELIVQLNPSRLHTCSEGWRSILYDADGHPHESEPSGTLSYIICGRLQGQLVLSARCGREYLRDWPGPVGHSANQGGVASILLDGHELATAECLLCYDAWSPTPGVRPIIPLEPYFYARCP